MEDRAPTEVVTLEPTNYELASNLLGRAFVHDPMWVAVISDSQKLPEMLVEMFSAVTKTSVAAGGIAETTPGVEAVALWLPPGKEMGTWAIVKARLSMTRFVMRMPADDRKRMISVLGQLEERKKALMPEPCWHLLALGVEPNHQGEGLGSSLVRAGMHRADDDGSAIYLETDTKDNVRFYQNHGFDVLERIVVEAIDVPVWLMRRAPSSKT